MKVKENVTLYICDHCRKRLIRKSAMEKHEVDCTQNPANRSKCGGCVFLKEVQKEFWVDTYGGETARKANGFFCTKLNVGMYPHKAVRLGLVDKYPDQFDGEIKMPTECVHWNWMIE